MGEKGPSSSDVIGAALGTLRDLLVDCHASQLADAFDYALSCLDRGFSKQGPSGWADPDRCCWLAESMTRFTMLPYRSSMPVVLLDKFSCTLDQGSPTQNQLTMLKMLEGIYRAPNLSLTGFAPTEALDLLLTGIQARCNTDDQDPLIVPLVDCVSALGTHAYYVGQADDMMEVIVSRIAEIQMTGPRMVNLSRSRKGSMDSRASTPATTEQPPPPSVPRTAATQSPEADAEAMRVMVACMTNLLLSNANIDDKDSVLDSPGIAAHPTMARTQSRTSAATIAGAASDKGKRPDRAESRTSMRRSRRNVVSPEVWQETLPLLCEAKFALRAEYARALILYIRQDLAVHQSLDPHSSRFATTRASVVRFLHALDTTLYSLAISSRLGYAGPALSTDALGKPQQQPHQQTDTLGDLPISATAGKAVPLLHVQAPTRTNSTAEPQSPDSSATPEPARLERRRTSKLVALPFSRHHSAIGATVPTTSNSEPMPQNVAGPLDYLHIREIISALLQVVPGFMPTIVVPMLLALDRDAGTVLVRRSNDLRDNIFIAERRRACREVVVDAWSGIAREFGLDHLASYINEVSHISRMFQESRRL